MLFPLNKEKLNDIINDKIILITGGTSWTYQNMVKILLEEFAPKKIIIYSRDEYKQSLMQKIYPFNKYPCMRYFIGCIRDKERLEQAFENVDVVFHAAALKQIDTIEYNPDEAIKTNVEGTRNVISTAKKCGVKYVVGVSTDKSSNPACLYGASKYCAEKLLVAANNMSGGKTKFCAVRYGNVLFSRGSVGEIFLEQKKSGTITITDKRMTRFTITAEEAIRFSLNCLADMIGGEVFVPKIPSYNITQLAQVIAPECIIKEIGMRPGEKLNESMIADYESYLTIEDKNRFIITPTIPFIKREKYFEIYGDKLCPENYEYNSNNNEYISNELLNTMLEEYISKQI
jgi:UDP-N-acetylglucosamine 4,6-dehydratase